MMRSLFIIFVVLACSGCGVTLRSDVLPAKPAVTTPSLGMTRTEVSALMTRTVVMGYDTDPATGKLRPMETGSLYSTEFLTVGKDVYVVDHYINGIVKEAPSTGGGRVLAESSLTPMIFKNNILAGQGNEALADLKRRQGNEK